MNADSRMPDKRLAVILPAAFLASLAIGTVNQGMIFLVKEEYGASATTVGAFAALWSAAYLAGCILLRPLAKRISARSSMAAMNIAAATILAAQFALPGLASSFVAFGLYGFSCAFFWPRIMGWLARGIEGKALGRASGAFSFSWSVGGVISPYVSGLLTERALRLPVYVGACIFFATGAFILASRRIAPSPTGEGGPPAESATGGSERAARADRSTPLRFPAWIGVFIVYAFVAVFLNIFPLYAKDELGMSESTIGLVLLARSASTAFFFWLFGRMSYWHFRPALIPLALACALVLDLAFTIVRGPWGIALCLALSGAAMADIYGKSVFYGASGAPDRDKRMTIHEALLSAGQVFGSLAGGAIYQGFSWSAVFVGIGALMAVGVVLQTALVRRR
ncbi:MAG: MFS transporter [Spirochaetaceae bacterium]|nr:MFS transporter [Spirochaetaceae bacterium]